MDYKLEIDRRVSNRLRRSLLDVNTRLVHFAIITYKIPVEKIKHLIPEPFKLWTFIENDQEYALVSAVPFQDKDFSFYRMFKFLKFKFYQTNFRTYIVDKRDGSTAAWFFGTTLGSITSIIPKWIWKMPWEYGKYKFNYKLKEGSYSHYKMNFNSKQGNGIVDICGSKNKMSLLKGFESVEQQILILTHPVVGYYYRSNDTIGTYSIWHPQMELQEGIAQDVYFEIFENLGFLTKEEMKNPHSILMTPEIEFDILLPPRIKNQTIN